MKWYDVCLSQRAWPAEDIDRLLQQQAVNAGNTTLSAQHYLRLVGLTLGQTLVRETCHFSNLR